MERRALAVLIVVLAGAAFAGLAYGSIGSSTTRFGLRSPSMPRARRW